MGNKYVRVGVFILMIVLVITPTIKDIQKIQKTENIVANWKKVDNVNGLIHIDSIDLHLPINHGATHENMIHGVATMTHEQPRKNKNFTLAGHRNLKKGRNFNRLNEVDIEDVILIENYSGIHKYIVTDKFIVFPDEVGILEDTGKTEITLITCYPIAVSNQRLVIKGEYIETKGGICNE